MAKVRPPPFVTQLTINLRDTLKDVGISATVDSERVPGTKLYRFFVLAKKFDKIPHSERQSIVWRIADHTLNPATRMRISMILTLTPEEANGE